MSVSRIIRLRYSSSDVGSDYPPGKGRQSHSFKNRHSHGYVINWLLARYEGMQGMRHFAVLIGYTENKREPKTRLTLLSCVTLQHILPYLHTFPKKSSNFNVFLRYVYISSQTYLCIPHIPERKCAARRNDYSTSD